MKRQFLATALIVLCGSAFVALPALAQARQDNSPAVAATPAQNGSATKAQSAKAKQRAVPPLDSNMCVRDTGSHIRPPKGQCLPVNGNSYSRQDIQRTGAVTTGQALQMLDPSVTIHGH
jgi:hypothetical protein